MEQHYRMTLQDALAKYESGDITIKGLIHFYILIKCKPGWRIRIDYETLSKELPVKKSTFYHVISCLKKEGAIAWEAVKGILVSRVTSEPESIDIESESQILESESKILESESKILDSQSKILESESQILESQAPKSATHNHYSDSPDLYSSLDQLLPNSLSEEQRESFVEFGKKKASLLPNPPILSLKWIKTNFNEIFESWQKQSGIVTNQANNRWENHPKKEEWLDRIDELGGAISFILENGSVDPERQLFVNWVRATKSFRSQQK